MSDASPPSADPEAFKEALAAATADARSLAQIAAWLRSHPGVRSVRLEGYLLKSNPPQRDFTVEFRTAGGRPERKIVNVFDLGGGRFRFNRLRDP